MTLCSVGLSLWCGLIRWLYFHIQNVGKRGSKSHLRINRKLLNNVGAAKFAGKAELAQVVLLACREWAHLSIFGRTDHMPVLATTRWTAQRERRLKRFFYFFLKHNHPRWILLITTISATLKLMIANLNIALFPFPPHLLPAGDHWVRAGHHSMTGCIPIVIDKLCAQYYFYWKLFSRGAKWAVSPVT